MTDRETRHAELAERFLPDALLRRLRDRAAVLDRENRFGREDFEELKQHGYLTLFVPAHLGGGGLSLHEVSRLQQRLATAAPATALAVNMHLMCTGVARAMIARGDNSLARVLEEAAQGEIFAFGISEPSNDWVLQGSNTIAELQTDGGYLLTGAKVFTSLSPVWTRLLAHGAVAQNPADRARRDQVSGHLGKLDEQQLIYGFIERDDPGVAISEHWDVLGMRASESRGTRLDGARIAPERVARVIPAGPHPDLLTFSITSHFQLLIASVYAGVARRAIDLGAEALRSRTSAKAESPLAEVAERRVRIADAQMELMAVPAQIDAYTRDFDELVDHGKGWPLRLVSARINASTAARRSVETALVCAGGGGFDNAHELSRLHRDATASLFHPPSADAARPMYAAALLDD